MSEPMEIKFPIKGINTASSYIAQPEGTTPYAMNVRPEDSLGGRIRGGSRGGISKYNTTILTATGVQCIQTVPVARDINSVDPDALVYASDFDDYTVDVSVEQNDPTIWEGRCTGNTTNSITRNPFVNLWTAYGTTRRDPIIRSSATMINKYAEMSVQNNYCSCRLKTHTTGTSYIIKAGVFKDYTTMNATKNAICGIGFRIGNNATPGQKDGLCLTLGYPSADPLTKYSLSLYYTNSDAATTEIFYDADLTLPASGVWYNSTTAKLVEHSLEIRVNGNYFEIYMNGVFVKSITSTQYVSNNEVAFLTYRRGTASGITSLSLYSAKQTANISDTKIASVSGGNVYDVTSTSLTQISTATFSSSDRIHAQGAFQKFYFCGGTSATYQVYDPILATVAAWTPTLGTLPTDTSGFGCKYITLYRGRIVLWGLYSSPQNWYMSKAGDPLDWEYAPEVSSEVQAIAGNNSTAGLLGDALMACIPYSDDLMLMGGDHTMWVMRGDPAAGGVIDLISEKTGMRSPDAFCIDPGGTIYFVGTDGVYTFTGDSVQSITEASLRGVFEAIDYTKYWPIMEWSYFERGCYVTLVPINATTDDYITYFYHPETQSWWMDTYPDNIGPYVLKAVDGNKPNDTATLIGSPDGYIRYVNDAATTDDGTAITSEVDVKTIYANASQDVKITDIRAITDTGSASLTAKIYKGNTPQQAIVATTPSLAKTLVAGRSTPIMQRISAPALRVRLSATGRWGLEQLMVTVDSGGQNKVHRG